MRPDNCLSTDRWWSAARGLGTTALHYTQAKDTYIAFNKMVLLKCLSCLLCLYNKENWWNWGQTTAEWWQLTCPPLWFHHNHTGSFPSSCCPLLKRSSVNSVSTTAVVKFNPNPLGSCLACKWRRGLSKTLGSTEYQCVLWVCVAAGTGL